MIKALAPFYILLFLLPACAPAGHAAQTQNRTIILAVTSSVQDTGLLDVLVDSFQEAYPYKVKPLAVGSGQAIRMGRLGEADILLSHSPEDEIRLVNEGYGMDRTEFMHNDFVILGPRDDPATIMGAKDVAWAFKKIAASKALFVSRGDNSGTHKKEKAIWKDAEVAYDKYAYMETGQGMARTLAVANEKKGYVLADRATYLSLRKTVDLEIVCEGDERLINRYSLILINPDKFPNINGEGARALFNFLLSGDSKRKVENFGKEKFGQQLFFWDL